MNTENWLPVVGAEGEYEVSDYGRVRSLPRIVVDELPSGVVRSRRFLGRVLRPQPRHPQGHLRVFLGKDRPNCWVHVLVLRAFVGEPLPGMECRHLDGDPRNNVLSNLRWGTRSRNHQDRKHHDGWVGHKLSAENVRELRSLFYSGEPAAKLARRFGIARTNVYRVVNGEVHGDVR